MHNFAEHRCVRHYLWRAVDRDAVVLAEVIVVTKARLRVINRIITC